ncbi:hypothetical protein [Thioflexithrix psekupsensis]|nr:hypothetical protein [Thioflexithrix psekupsensis]
MKFFRAISVAEAEQIALTKKLAIAPCSVEGKYFTDTFENAKKMGIFA